MIIGLGMLLACTLHKSYAANYPDQPQQEGRYEMLIPEPPNGYGTRTSYRKVPAIVLDTWQGAVFRCINLEDENPIWIKDELAKDSPPSSKKRFSGRISNLSGPELRISALIINITDGKAWNCMDITKEDAKWILTDLTKPTPGKKGIYSEE
ncbi:MAG: hypothetical protein NTV07_03415 [Candidatus Omnitrophica bacterium]|nr:hypothetical protein [Candidatus Omnitrophota bacterium]